MIAKKAVTFEKFLAVAKLHVNNMVETENEDVEFHVLGHHMEGK